VKSWIPLAVIVVVAAAGSAGLFLWRSRMLRWGATQEEFRLSLPGDQLIGEPVLCTTRATLIDAPPEKIWPWLAQMGQGRGGFYSYEWLENLVGLDIHNSDRIIPELQELKPGDLIPFWRGAGVNVVEMEPDRLLLLAGTLTPGKGTQAEAGTRAEVGGTWVFSLERAGSGVTRLVIRTRVAPFPPTWLSKVLVRLLLEPAHFIMERRMLLGIKERAEAL
jgi:hypothetical protein